MDDRTTDSVLNKIFHRHELLSSDDEIHGDNRGLLAVPILKKPAPGFMFAIARFIFKLGGTPFWEKHLTTLFYGPRSQGKSLHQAKTVKKILEYLDALYRFYPALPQSIVISNQKFNAKMEEKYLNTRLFYWESIQQLKYCPRPACWKNTLEVANLPEVLEGAVPIPRIAKHRLHDCYIIIDDAATIIPADGWQDLPRWFRKVFAQAGHNGVHCVANIQDPTSCDINFRRYVDLCFKFTKVMGNRRPEAGKPPVGLIWGLYTSREIPAEELWRYGDRSEAEIEYEKELQKEQESLAKEAGKRVIKMATTNWKRRYHLIRRKDTEIYDTLQNVPEYMPNSFEHIELKCTDPNCDHISVRHRVI